MIALDPDHTTDPDYPVEFLNRPGQDPDAPIWCEWEWVVVEGGESYMTYCMPLGQTVPQLVARYTGEKNPSLPSG